MNETIVCDIRECIIISPKMPVLTEQKIIFTIGHSTRTIDELTALLKTHEIQTVIDIRSVPKSRHNPQFNQEELKIALRKKHIGYCHFKELGGLRHPIKDSRNSGWINASFRGYADYMQTELFEEGMEKLEAIAAKKRCALLCAEAIPWKCHRSLVADALTVRKWKVFHIQSHKSPKQHKRTSFLRVRKGVLFYPQINTEF